MISKLGYPDDISSTTTNGYAEFPCVYYDYNDAKELGEVSFILINNEVVKLVSYNTYPYSKGKALLESFGVTMGEDGAKEETDTYSRFRCPTEKVDDIWVTNVDSTTSTFGTLQVTYDMFYFEEFYLPMDTIEQSDYQWYTMETVKELLKAPNTADFPNILEWSFWKNPFYVGVKSYVDAQNSLGAEVRSEFFFIYKTDTSEIVYATFDNEVIANNDYIKTEELVSQLIDSTLTDNATNQTQNLQNTTTTTTVALTTETVETNTEHQEEYQSIYIPQDTEPTDTITSSYINPSFNGGTCLDIDYNTGMPAYIVSQFTLNDDIMVAGCLSGVTGENNLIVRFICPDGTTDDTLQYYIVNNETINTALNADYIGVGTGTVQVILEATGQVLATYAYTITE